MIDDLSRLPGGRINRVFRLLLRRGETRFTPLGLAMGQVPVLMALKDGASLSQKDLVRLAQIEQPTMAVLLSRMERDGLIVRSPDPSDKRSSLISLTPAAREKIPHARLALIAGQREALAGFSDDEIETLNSLLTRMVHNLERTRDKE